MQADEWIERDKEHQLDVFRKTGKRLKRYENPPRVIFDSDEEHQAAIKGRLILCDKEGHEGERLLTRAEVYGNAVCKSCKCSKQSAIKAEKREPRRVYETAQAWFEANANTTSETHPELGIGSCKEPKRDEFTTDAAFQEAVLLREDNNREYRRQRNGVQEVNERNNQAARERYAEAKETEEGREKLVKKMMADQEHKKARKMREVPEGYAMCCVGPHLSILADMMFDPVTELGMTDFKGDRNPNFCRTACKLHFRGIVETSRRREETEKRIKYNYVRDWKRVAEQNGISYELSAEDEEAILISDEGCYFCGQGPQTNRPLGINQICHDLKRYSPDNIVLACNLCKNTRGRMSIKTFQTACANIAAFTQFRIASTQQAPYVMGEAAKASERGGTMPLRQGSGYNTLQIRAEKKEFVLEWTKEEYDAMQVGASCYLCGLPGTVALLGLDRLDNEGSYTHENAKPCCPCCNMMKRNTAYGTFVDMCCAVATKAARSNGASSSTDPN